MQTHDDPLDTFREEARELLADFEESLLCLEDDPRDVALIDAAFRSLHTIKGSGDMFDLPVLATFAHAMEAVFDRLGTGKTPVTRGLLSLALRAKDHLEALLFTPDVAGLQTQGDEILKALRRLAPPAAGGDPARGAQGDAGSSAGADPAAGARASAEPAAGERPPEGERAPAAGRASSTASVAPTGRGTDTSGAFDPNSNTENRHTFQIIFAPSQDYFRHGGNPLAIFEELRELGDAAVVGVIDDLPELSEMEPDACYLRWNIRLTTAADLETVSRRRQPYRAAASAWMW